MNLVKLYIILIFSFSVSISQHHINNWKLLGFEKFTVDNVFAKNDTIWVTVFDSTHTLQVHFSSNGGIKWERINDSDSLINQWIGLVGVNPGNFLEIIAKTADETRGLISQDGGHKWTYAFPDISPWTDSKIDKVSFSKINPNVKAIRLKSWISESLVYKTNKGEWNSFGSGIWGELAFCFDNTDTNKIYLAAEDGEGNSGFFIINKNSTNWDYRSRLPTKAQNINVDWKDNNVIYLGFYRSDDYGRSWARKSTGLPNKFIFWALIIDPFDSSVLYMSTDKGIYKSINKGEEWSLMKGSEELNLDIKIHTNYGKMDHLFIDPVSSTLYIGTQEGLYKYKIVTSISKNTYRSKEYYLSQNYPNPFNPITKIDYRLAKNIEVTLKIYDISGREIITLVSGQKNPGEHSATFDSGDMPSGVYFYRLTTSSGFSQSRKMVLIK